MPSVATREGGVDRNAFWLSMMSRVPVSPPARVAWIETILIIALLLAYAVATREGGVDRNDYTKLLYQLV